MVNEKLTRLPNTSQRREHVAGLSPGNDAGLTGADRSFARGPSNLGSFCQKSRPRLYLIETTAADLHSPPHFGSALPKTERHKRRLILPARIRAETGYGDGVAPQLRSEHEPEERLPQPEQRAGMQLAQAAAA